MVRASTHPTIFMRIHEALRTAPAMTAGVAEYPMKIEDIVEMLPLPVAKKRGKCKKRAS